MGRKSSLTADQWLEVERRYLVGGESLNALAVAFGVNESSLRRRLKPASTESTNRKNPLHALAQEKVRADAENKRISQQIAHLPYANQMIVSDLVRKLANISEHLGSAAEISAASAHRLARLSNQQLELVDDINPMGSPVHMQAAAVLQKMANSAMEGPLNLLRANKQEVAPAENPFESLLAAVNGSALKVIGHE